MKITVMGLGYIGLPTAITLAEAGFEVCGFDVNKKTIETLQGGHIHIVEPGLQEAFEKAVAHGHLHFSDTLGKSDVFYISVPTPFYKDETGSHKADLKFVESAGRMAGKVLEAPNLVILESTVPPHTSEMLARVLSEESGIPMEKIHVAHCPERVIPGNMMYELKNNDRIVGARTPEAAEMAASIYEKVLDRGVVHKTDDLTAEMCKLTENTFRDVNIAYANELSVICDKMGIDVFELIKLANCHPRVNILQPGPGVGGHCIAVDPWFIVAQNPQQARLIRTAREVNDHKPEWVIEQVKAQVADCLNATNKRASELTIACFGLAFKPNIDDLRESPAMEIAAQIARWHSGTTQVVEPNIHALPKKLDGLCTLATLEAALASAEVLVMLVDHNQFKAVSGDSVTQAFIVDTKGVWR